MVSRAAIIDMTHYGLNIYAYVLRQYYPGTTVLSLSGRDCGITRNPFNDDKETLSVCIKDGMAIHTDIDLPTFKGDVFDFAAKYFKSKNEDDLLLCICDALHLNIKVKDDEDPLAWLNDDDNTWYTDISFFKAPIRNVFPSETLRLHHIYELISSDKYKSVTIDLRAITDPKIKRKFKANNLDYVTFSGVFERRNDNNLVKHSHLITIDFDHLENLEKTRQLLLADKAFDTELLFASPSGDGLKWIVRVDLEQATHAQYFQAITNYLQHTYNIEVDASGKDVSRACFLCHDPNAFLHKRHRAL